MDTASLREISNLADELYQEVEDNGDEFDDDLKAVILGYLEEITINTELIFKALLVD